MIKVTRLNNTELWINADLIEFLEVTPDTIITLNTHDKILVKEHPAQIVEAIIEYRRRIAAQLPPIMAKEE